MGLESIGANRVVDSRARAAGFAPFGHLLSGASAVRRDSAISALNGLLGDHLRRIGHPLARGMQLRCGDDWLVGDGAVPPRPNVRPQVIVLVHSICESDRSWRREGFDTGQALQRATGATVLLARFNSGLPVPANGLALAQALDAVLARWPVELQSVSIVGHGQGGLVARAATHAATRMAWRRDLRHLVFIATPHFGLPLEHAGHWVHRVLDLCPYAGPFARLSELRSPGLIDMQQGRVLADDGLAYLGLDLHDGASPLPLPADVHCCAVASTIGGPLIEGSRDGDGLVPLSSALGDHPDARRALGIADHDRWVGEGLQHLQLLAHPPLIEPLRRWLAA